MKKLYLFILLLLPIGLMAEEYEVVTKDGKKYYGEYVSRTDTTFTIRTKSKGQAIDYCFDVNVFTSARSFRGGEFKCENGKIIGQTYQESFEQYQKEEATRIAKLNANPNYTHGNAMVKVGSTALVVGVPSLLVGTILVGVGFGKIKQYSKMTEDIAAGREVDKNKYSKLAKDIAQNKETYLDCQTAGSILMPFGGTLTLVGVPLVIHGKEIMNINLQLSENGAGVALNF